MRRAGLEGAGCQRYRPKRQGVPRGSIALAGLVSGCLTECPRAVMGQLRSVLSPVTVVACFL